MIDFDAPQDTPIELLHTILLGVKKYSWTGTHKKWTDEQKGTFSVRLQASSIKGLSVPAIRSKYIMQYANSLIGRQFKTLVQLNAFHVHDLVGREQYQLVKAVGVLCALLWVPEIYQLDEYLVSGHSPQKSLPIWLSTTPQADVEIAAANVLDAAAAIDPSKILTKMKYHLLAHLTDDIRRFGPLIGVATEGYESYNTIFRHCSVLSNHLAPSRDIAYQQSKQETFSHISTGGWWKETDTSWSQAGSSLMAFVLENEILQKLFHVPTHTKEPTVGKWHFFETIWSAALTVNYRSPGSCSNPYNRQGKEAQDEDTTVVCTWRNNGSRCYMATPASLSRKRHKVV
jgi:hypothetical protein